MPETGQLRLDRNLIVISPNIGGAEKGACFAYRLPTSRIEHDVDRVAALERCGDFVDDFSIPYYGREQSVDEIAEEWYVDGLLVLKDGKIVFEKYYGQLTETRPHLMNSVSKSVVALLAGKLAGEGVIDLSKPVSH